MTSITKAHGRLGATIPVAVIDIGSNSVRLVIYEGARRSPTPLFNEKVLCGLGRELATAGRLAEDSVERALLALRRFRAIAQEEWAEWATRNEMTQRIYDSVTTFLTSRGLL